MEKKKNSSKGWGVSSLICGVAGLLLFLMPYLGLPFSILALVFKAQQDKRGSTGCGTAGLITGIVGIVINSVMLVFVLLVLLAAFSLSSI